MRSVEMNENYKREKIKIAYKSIDTNDNELLRA